MVRIFTTVLDSETCFRQYLLKTFRNKEKQLSVINSKAFCYFQRTKYAYSTKLLQTASPNPASLFRWPGNEVLI
jgi:hypothetical protein